jgi:uncharacterized membrane protein
MLKIESTTVINRPVEDVFAVLGNLENHPKWNSGFLEVKKTSQGPIGVGTTWRADQARLLGQRMGTEIEVTEYEPNRKYEVKNKLPFPAVVQMAFASVEGGTRVNYRLEGEPGGFFKLAEPLVASMAKRKIENDLATLKDLMDAHAL